MRKRNRLTSESVRLWVRMAYHIIITVIALRCSAKHTATADASGRAGLFLSMNPSIAGAVRGSAIILLKIVRPLLLAIKYRVTLRALDSPEQSRRTIKRPR